MLTPHDPFTSVSALPVLSPIPERERADAARNRARILAAAELLFTRDGIARTSMDAIAAEAGVGKGTLFRRFGDRASLAFALLDSSERAFQEAFIRGPAPLGPGAPPRARLVAFGRALLAHIEAHGDLLLAAYAATPADRRFDVGPQSAYRTHVAHLLDKADPALDADYLAEAFLAVLGPEHVLHQLIRRGMTPERLAQGWETLVARVLPTG
jgi:AcrR family transcriptional regulator